MTRLVDRDGARSVRTAALHGQVAVAPTRARRRQATAAVPSGDEDVWGPVVVEESAATRVDPSVWVQRLAATLGVDAPDAEQVDDLLSLAGTAAHAAERRVAPVSTWLVALAGLEPAEGRAAVRRLADDLAKEQAGDQAGDQAVEPAEGSQAAT